MSDPIKIKRQAVVIVHGIGEQRPMETVRAFVNAIMRIDSSSDTGQPTWVKPDKVSEGFEHRRFTIPGHRKRPITDVYEFYWAHLFQQETHRTFINWLGRLVIRRRSKLPERYRRTQLWLRLGIFAAIVIAAVLLRSVPSSFLDVIPLTIFLTLGFVWYWVNFWLLNHLADASRYLDASPRNVISRNAVRKLGINFLRELHTSERGYNRIVFCGHSLGSVVGFDVLNHFWYERHDTFQHLDRYDQYVLKNFMTRVETGKVDEYRDNQRALFQEMTETGLDWAITDFITLGSPLAHADLLLADSAHEFELLKKEGVIPTCPPTPDQSDGKIWHMQTFRRPDGEARTARTLNGNSVFSVVRWTNITIQQHGLVIGDPISGELAGLFGNGVRDLSVKLPLSAGWFQHNCYWRPASKQKLNDALIALRKALVLDHRRY